MAETGNQPDHVIKTGNIEIPVWRKETKNGKTMFRFYINKPYKDAKTGEFRNGKSFMNWEIGDLEESLKQLREWLDQQKNTN